MAVIEEICTITSKGRTTVPKAIRQVLGVDYGDRIAFRVEDGTVSVHAVTELDADPALAPFLALLERDFAARPEELVSLTPNLVARMTTATQGAVADLDDRIDGDIAL